ncbi:MAG: YraN family protein [Nitratireductor sp.]
MSKDFARQQAQKRGLFAESLAAGFLRLKGYKIVERNYKTKFGEIDIIARKGDLIAIVEVKARANVQAAIDSVSYEASRRIENTADHWLAKQEDYHLLSTRFDIIAIEPSKWPAHLKDAF